MWLTSLYARLMAAASVCLRAGGARYITSTGAKLITPSHHVLSKGVQNHRPPQGCAEAIITGTFAMAHRMLADRPTRQSGNQQNGLSGT